jgi:hypothetical protein
LVRHLSGGIPPKQVTDFQIEKFDYYYEQKRIKTGAPKISGKNALIFCTYSGPHTGINEATPVGKHIGQFFEHLGFTVLGDGVFLANFMAQKNAAQKAEWETSEENQTKMT